MRTSYLFISFRFYHFKGALRFITESFRYYRLTLLLQLNSQRRDFLCRSRRTIPFCIHIECLRNEFLCSGNNKLENVLILQGGGSLGAFGCGVFKALANNNIKLDIVAGTSIGGINAAIIAGSKDEKHPEQMLEQFWLELSQSFVDLDKVTLPSSAGSLPKFVEDMLVSSGYY